MQGSDRPQTYVHLSGRDLDADYLRQHGIEPEEEEEDKSELAPEQCPRCNELVDPEASFCANCGRALDVKAAAELQEGEEKAEEEQVADEVVTVQELKAEMEKMRQEFAELRGAGET